MMPWSIDPVRFGETSLAFDESMFALLIPIIALMIPIVAILVRHQQRMAEIIHSSPHANPNSQGQIEAMRAEIAELRNLVHQQAIAMDNLAGARQTRSIE